MRRLLLCLVALVGCAPDPMPLEFTEEQNAVHMMLQAGDTFAGVVLTRVRASKNAQLEPYSKPLTGATVRLREGANTFVLPPDGPIRNRCRLQPSGPLDSLVWRAGCYAADMPGGVRAGATYQLEIDLPGGGRVTGAATVPAPLAFETPTGQLALEFSATRDVLGPGVPVRWSASDAAARVYLTVRFQRSDCSVLIGDQTATATAFVIDVTSRDSVMLHGGRIFCGGQDQAQQYDAELVLIAYDRNYVNFLNRGLSGPINVDDVSSGITGATGVFAAVAYTRLPAVLRRLQSSAIPNAER
jgi:hypothetical protein